jgi:hypothetical protein
MTKTGYETASVPMSCMIVQAVGFFMSFLYYLSGSLIAALAYSCLHVLDEVMMMEKS